MIIKDPAVRRYIYVVAAAAIAVLVLLGFVVEDHVQVWLNLVAALLGLPVAGLAAPNTPKESFQAAIKQPGTVTINTHYPEMTPGEHVIQAKIPSIDVGKLDDTMKQTTGETPPRTE